MKGSSQRVIGEGKVGKLKVSLLKHEILQSKKVEVRQRERGRLVSSLVCLFVGGGVCMLIDFIYSE